MNNSFIVVGIGELLWDVFPTGKHLGGAPVNFCYHAQQLGGEGYPVSAVSDDIFGQEIREELASKNLSDTFVAEDAHHPTGMVQVTLDDQGKPSYEICEEVAWDYIPVSEKLEALAQKTDAACFGSLAQRHHFSRSSIAAFLSSMNPDALKIFDVNLRQDFYSKEIINDSLTLCNILKLSDEELPALSEMFGFSGSISEQLAALLTSFNLQLIAYTRGSDGSLLVAPDKISDHPGCPSSAINSVGAGDSFTAALCMGLLDQKTLDEINEQANRVAAFVCSQDGATPMLPEEVTQGELYA